MNLLRATVNDNQLRNRQLVNLTRSAILVDLCGSGLPAVRIVSFRKYFSAYRSGDQIDISNSVAIKWRPSNSCVGSLGRERQQYVAGRTPGTEDVARSDEERTAGNDRPGGCQRANSPVRTTCSSTRLRSHQTLWIFWPMRTEPNSS